jgi:hypothetical protein
MAKPSITTRTAKGSPLTIAEMDGNLTNLQDGFIKIAIPGNRTQMYPSGMITPSTAQKKFGDRSAEFNGTTNNISIYGMGEISTSPWSVSSMSFCAEQFIWIDSTGTGERTIFDTRSMMGEHNGLQVYLNSAGLLKARRGSTEIATSATALATNTWLHLAVERFTYGGHPTYSSGLYLLVNGAVVGQWTNSMDSFENSSQITYGRDKTSSNYFKGYMDEIRWSKSTSRYMPNMPMGSINPAPTAELSNDYSTSYLLHLNDASGITDDVFQTFNLDLNDRFVINKSSPATLSADPTNKQITIGIDTGALVIQQFVAVQTANSINNAGARQGRLDFGYNEVIDQQSFVSGQGNGIFQIQNNTTNSQNYLIEMYGDATTAATGSIELYNHTMNYGVGNQYTITGGAIPTAAWSTNVGGNTSVQFSIGKNGATGSESLTGGTMFLKITRV